MSAITTVQTTAINITSTPAMPAVDDDPSGLAKAVAALDVQRAPHLAKDSSLVVDSTGSDSGYASQISTPESSKGQFGDGGSVVAKGTRLWPLPQRKTVKLKPFAKTIPQLTWNRFQDLRELHAESLNKLTRQLPRCQGILMTLEVLGESECTAEPWVFIQCDRIIAKKVRNFFKQPIVKSDFQPPRPDAYSPHLPIYVCELPPRPLGRSPVLPTSHPIGSDTIDPIEVSIDEHTRFPKTLCGAKIRIHEHGSNRTATLGGLIKVLDYDGGFVLFGLTAGHFLAQEHSKEDDTDFQAEFGYDLDRAYSDEEDIYELDLSSLEVEFSSEQGLPFGGADAIEQPQIHESWSRMGHIHTASSDRSRAIPNLDWALIEIETNSLCLPNEICTQKVTQFGFPSSDVKVNLTRGAHGSTSGTLSTSWSYLMLAPGKDLIRTHLLTLSGNKSKVLSEEAVRHANQDFTVLHTGDSGCWVIDGETGQVYGHVIASDVFGNAYVVQIDDIFEDIKNFLSARSVCLPLECEIQGINDVLSTASISRSLGYEISNLRVGPGTAHLISFLSELRIRSWQGAEYHEQPHHALSQVASHANSIKSSLGSLHIPPHVRGMKSGPVVAGDFGNFAFKNLPILEKANKEVIQKLRAEAMAAQRMQATTAGINKTTSSNSSPSTATSTPSLKSTCTSASSSPSSQSSNSIAPFSYRRSQVFDMSPSSSDSEDDKATSLFRVQRRRQSSKRMSKVPLNDEPVFRPLDVLICEDHPVSRIVMEKLLRNLQCCTVTVSDGAEAIRYAMSEIKFDIIMMEFKLPLISGADVARMIRETKNTNSQTPIVVVTGYVTELTENSYFSDLIEKPPTTSKLTEAMCRLCQWKPPAPSENYLSPTGYLPPGPRQENLRIEDSSASGSSSSYSHQPDNSFRGSSRDDSIDSSLYGDPELCTNDDILVVNSREALEDWNDPHSHGTINATLDSRDLPKTGPRQTLHEEDAPTRIEPTLKVQQSFEKTKVKRGFIGNRHQQNGVESGDDEDELLGDVSVREKSSLRSATKTHRASKLGTERIRTHGRGNVVSNSDLNRSAETIKPLRTVAEENFSVFKVTGGILTSLEVFPTLGAEVAEVDIKRFSSLNHQRRKSMP